MILIIGLKYRNTKANKKPSYCHSVRDSGLFSRKGLETFQQISCLTENSGRKEFFRACGKAVAAKVVFSVEAYIGGVLVLVHPSPAMYISIRHVNICSCKFETDKERVNVRPHPVPRGRRLYISIN